MDTLDTGLFSRWPNLLNRWVPRTIRGENPQGSPDPVENDDSEWAELRVSAQANQVYEMRKFDQPDW